MEPGAGIYMTFILGLFQSRHMRGLILRMQPYPDQMVLQCV